MKALKEVLNELVLQISAKKEIKDSLKHQEEVLVHLIYV